MTNSAASARGLLEQIAALYTGADYLAHLMDVICSIRTGSRLQYFVMSSSILRTLEKMPQTGAFPTDFWPKLPKGKSFRRVFSPISIPNSCRLHNPSVEYM
ncbi:hypothetical protein MPTK1_4g19880 [Marchantia polymorpha subsp. ruderalis]|uniref:Uncharacterized protein n=2 Tax=Marchantia polymorpha TaxID=3197 RepID=A0AAF6BBS4_MARPO|nr:hypothetical protein MARPO_0126s0006 [Marchantia polymorpha]BBN09458.1 hypothetical protein Mp_4g19880 [Marchantia polymorpha subsp. ruderalis]|eukprot:PTQ30285.1 hypothetical protein MARPO_0126s0006 [Marchantia polymorpha]